jgi:glycosyltransferase involved in cell wall biosynthesis
MIRVAHFVQRYPPALGGAEAYFGLLSRKLAAWGDRVTVFTTTALDLEAFWSARGTCLPAKRAWENGVEVRRYGLWRWPGRRYVLKMLSFIPHRLWQCLTMPCNPICWRMWSDAGAGRQRFDVVHATAFPYAWPIVCGLRLARRLRIPFLLTPFLHTGDPADPKDRTRRAYTSPALLALVHAADQVFVQTDVEKAALVERGISPDKLVRLGMGVQPETCTGGDRRKVRTAWGVMDGEVVVGHLANLSVEKGTVDLLGAAARAWKAGADFHLVLAGPQMPNFARFWQDFAPKDRVRYRGVLSEPDKRDFFAGLDVFALPSRSDSFGLVLLEAWANGIPNVAYRAGGVAEVIRHEQDGLLVPCGDVDALTATVQKLVGNSDLRHKLGEAGRERTAREFRWEDKVRRVRMVYGRVLRGEGNCTK